MGRTAIGQGRAVLVLVLVVGGACGAGSEPSVRTIAERRPVADNVVVDWNRLALQATATGPYDPPRESRTLAMVQGAVFSAVDSITGRFRRSLATAPAAEGASQTAAVAAAAHDVLVAVYPPQRAALDAAERATLDGVPDGNGEQAGIAAGQEAAARMLARRAGDHADEPAAYTPVPATGIWRPTPPASAPALDPNWASVTPFALDRPSQFRAPSPYALTSRAYARDFAEIKAVGSAASPVRTPDQTAAARFWAATAPQEWNQLVPPLAAARHLSRLDTARLYAQLNFAEADAAIAAWDTKFHYGQWRPITGIREAADDGNPATTADAQWTPLLATPPFPDYVCGHSALGGAAEAVFERWFGPRPRLPLTLTSASTPGVTRRYPTFAAIGDEVVNARVWGGVHWRTSCDAGRTLGRRVGRFVVDTTLRPTGHRSNH